MYELELAFMVVAHSQRDPGEYCWRCSALLRSPRGPCGAMRWTCTWAAGAMRCMTCSKQAPPASKRRSPWPVTR